MFSFSVPSEYLPNFSRYKRKMWQVLGLKWKYVLWVYVTWEKQSYKKEKKRKTHRNRKVKFKSDMFWKNWDRIGYVSTLISERKILCRLIRTMQVHNYFFRAENFEDWLIFVQWQKIPKSIALDRFDQKMSYALKRWYSEETKNKI